MIFLPKIPVRKINVEKYFEMEIPAFNMQT